MSTRYSIAQENLFVYKNFLKFAEPRLGGFMTRKRTDEAALLPKPGRFRQTDGHAGPPLRPGPPIKCADGPSRDSPED